MIALKINKVINSTFGTTKKSNESNVNLETSASYRKTEVFDSNLNKITNSYEPTIRRTHLKKELDFSKESLILHKFKSTFTLLMI